MTSYKAFGVAAGYPSTPFDELPAAFRTAMVNSSNGESTAADDKTMGSALTGYGFCADPAYRQQVYCACANAPIAYPECVFMPCANYGGQMGSYKTTDMHKALSNASKNCPQTVNCSQVFQMGGSGNIASGVTQTMNCGGVINNTITKIEAHPFLAIVVFVLIISVAMLLLGYRGGSDGDADDGGQSALPPPQLVLPATLL